MGQWPDNRLQAYMPMDDLEDVRDLNFTDIRGFQILNTTGHKVGSVKEVFVDPNTLEPGFALLVYQKFLNFNTKSLLVPWSELTIGPDYIRTRAADHLLPEIPAEAEDNVAAAQRADGEVDEETGVTAVTVATRAQRGEFG